MILQSKVKSSKYLIWKYILGFSDNMLDWPMPAIQKKLKKIMFLIHWKWNEYYNGVQLKGFFTVLCFVAHACSAHHIIYPYCTHSFHKTHRDKKSLKFIQRNDQILTQHSTINLYSKLYLTDHKYFCFLFFQLTKTHLLHSNLM